MEGEYVLYHVKGRGKCPKGICPGANMSRRKCPDPVASAFLDYISLRLSLLMRSLVFKLKTRRALGGAHVPRTKAFRRLTGTVNKTTLKPRLAAAANTYTSDFPDVKFRHSIPFHLFCKENGCQNATVNNAIEAVLKRTNVTVD